MLKDKRNIGIIILIVVVITALLILISKKMINNKANQQQENSNKINQTNNSLLSNEEKREAMNELSQIMANKTDKCVLIINGKEITEKEIAYVNFQKNSEVLHEGQEKKDAINKVIKEYVVAQDAKERQISLTEEESKSIEEGVKKNFQKDSDEMKEILNATYMNYEEYLEFYIARMKRLEIQTKWSLYITDAIKSGEINTDSKIFNQKCKECKQYLESKETISQGMKLLFELIEEYKELLKEKADIKYIN